MIFTKHPDGSITKEREHLSEFFVLEVREGEMVPRFFLPVYRLPRQHAMVAWLAPLAPFALIAHAFKEACISVWMDHVDWISYLRTENEKKRRDREALGWKNQANHDWHNHDQFHGEDADGRCGLCHSEEDNLCAFCKAREND